MGYSKAIHNKPPQHKKKSKMMENKHILYLIQKIRKRPTVLAFTKIEAKFN